MSSIYNAGHGGSPEDAVKSAFTSQINAYLKSNNKYMLRLERQPPRAVRRPK